MLVSGDLSSCDTIEMNSDFNRLSSSSRETSRTTDTAPATVPDSPASGATAQAMGMVRCLLMPTVHRTGPHQTERRLFAAVRIGHASPQRLAPSSSAGEERSQSSLPIAPSASIPIARRAALLADRRRHSASVVNTASVIASRMCSVFSLSSDTISNSVAFSRALAAAAHSARLSSTCVSVVLPVRLGLSRPAMAMPRLRRPTTRGCSMIHSMAGRLRALESICKKSLVSSPCRSRLSPASSKWRYLGLEAEAIIRSQPMSVPLPSCGG